MAKTVCASKCYARLFNARVTDLFVYLQEIEHLMKANRSSSYRFSTFSTATLNKELSEHSKSDLYKLGIVLIVVAMYSWFIQSGMAAMGVLLLASATAAGLGVCSLLGLPMNLLSTHVLPFVSVGIALREIFLLLTTQARNLNPPEVLLRTGPTILTSALTHSATFLTAAIIPVPVLRVFCLQCAVLIIFHTAATILVFPAMLALEIRCRKSGMPCFGMDKPATNNNNNDVVSILINKSVDSNFEEFLK